MEIKEAIEKIKNKFPQHSFEVEEVDTDIILYMDSHELFFSDEFNNFLDVIAPELSDEDYMRFDINLKDII